MFSSKSEIWGWVAILFYQLFVTWENIFEPICYYLSISAWAVIERVFEKVFANKFALALIGAGLIGDYTFLVNGPFMRKSLRKFLLLVHDEGIY